MGYLDSISGGIGGGANIYEGIQEGDVGQIVEGGQDVLGAYNAANNAIVGSSVYQNYIFQNAYQQAIEMGLEGTVATQYANNVLENSTALIGAEQVGKWLPFIGAGLIAYNAIENGIHTGQQGLMTGASLAATLGSGTFLGPLGWAAMALWRIPSLIRGPNVDRHIYWYQPDLEVIYKDDEGNYYLYDHNTINEDPVAREVHRGQIGKTANNDYNSGTLIKYNPETNEMYRGNIGYKVKDSGINTVWGVLTAEQVKKLLESGEITYENETYHPAKYYRPEETGWFPSTGHFSIEDLNWTEFDPRIKYGASIEGGQAFYNMPLLQSQIYNEVLLPYDLAPKVEGTPITINDEQYFLGSSGEITDTNGELIGFVDTETGQANSFKTNYRTRWGHSGIQEPTNVSIGNIDNWEEVKPLLDEETNFQLDQDNPQDSDTPEPEDLEQPQPDQQGFQGFTPIEQPEQSEQPQPDQQGFQGFTPIEQPEQPEQPQPEQPEQPQSSETETTEQPQPDQQGFQGFMPFEPMQQTGQGGFQGFTPINPSQQEENIPNSQGFIGFENPFEM
jgi:hypothetical protein